MKYIQSTLTLIALFAIGSVSPMEKKQQNKGKGKQTEQPQRKPQQAKKEYRQIVDQLKKIKPSADDIDVLSRIETEANKLKMDMLGQEFTPSGNLTKEQMKELQKYLSSEVSKNIDALNNDLYPTTTMKYSRSLQIIANNCKAKFPNSTVGDFGSIAFKLITEDKTNKVKAFSPTGNKNLRASIANAWYFPNQFI